jgi:hypothetical protein
VNVPINDDNNDINEVIDNDNNIDINEVVDDNNKFEW